jgi:hypothetical protein
MDYYEGLEDSPMVIEESLEDWGNVQLQQVA